MVSEGPSPLQWIVGGAYYDTVNDIFQTTDIPGAGFLRTVGQTSQQYALFGEAAYTLPTIPLTGRVGLRYFDEHATLASHVADPFGIIASTVPDQSGALNSSAVSPRFVLEYRFTPVVMVYGSISRGFRSGGINVDLEPLGFPTPGFQKTFKPDSVWTYELGAKTQWFEQRLQVNGALFYNKWQDLQIDGLPQDPSLGFTSNAGRAHSDGAEFEVTAVPTTGLTLTLGGSAIHAVLDEPAMGAPAGARLPNVPNYTFDGSISYERPIVGSYSAFIRLDGNYKGNTFGNLPNIPQSATNAPFQFVFRNEALAYGTANLRLGVENHRYSVTFFVENLTNSLASTFHFNDNAAFGLFGLFDEQEYISRPRTYGLELRANF
jgi:outer membrane receptor protein involved in Fe transport